MLAAMPKGFITRESSKWKLNYAVDNLNTFIKSIDSLVNVTKSVFQSNVIPEDKLDSAKRNFDLGARRYVSYKVTNRGRARTYNLQSVVKDLLYLDDDPIQSF